jgi:hypothetical protein
MRLDNVREQTHAGHFRDGGGKHTPGIPGTPQTNGAFFSLQKFFHTN